jgi:hypothetical protein
MHALLHILSEPLVSDNLWPVLVFLAALVIMPNLRAMGSHIAERRRRKLRRVVR